MGNQNKNKILKMEFGNFIVAAFTVVVMIIFGVIQYYTSKKANEAAELANKIQTQLNEFDIKKGELLLLGLTGKYFITVLNVWEQSGEMRKDKLSIKKYSAGLKNLDKEFGDLLGNTFYINLLDKYPDINLLLFSLRGEIIDKEEKPNPGIDGKTFELFYNFYLNLKSNIKYSKSLDSSFYKGIDEAAKFLKTAIDNLKNKSDHK